MKREKKAPLYKSFGYAFSGIASCIIKERNIKIHLVFTFFVVAAGLFFRISPTEWCICLILFGLILSLELINTSIESVVDLVTEERKPLAKLAKDTAAGAVLLSACMASIIGCIIFLPKIFRLFM
ncbi:MAG: diacylglycerol kinase family protein [Eubacteriales bacterium]|nr:diacylglycerol kinase family protein [Eubacteriales bacterium]